MVIITGYGVIKPNLGKRDEFEKSIVNNFADKMARKRYMLPNFDVERGVEEMLVAATKEILESEEHKQEIRNFFGKYEEPKENEFED